MPPKSVKGGRTNGADNSAKSDVGISSRIIRVIQDVKSPKLALINSLLRGVVQSASSVVKGTDSQRRFNVQFSEFCRSALVGINDLEDAVYELENAEGIVDNSNGSARGANRIGATGFIKAIITFIASQTNVLGEQYLEHVAMTALAAAVKQQQQHQQQKFAETKRGAKRGRTDDTRPRAPDRRSPLRKRMDMSPLLDASNDPDTPLPLLSYSPSSLPPPPPLPSSSSSSSLPPTLPIPPSPSPLQPFMPGRGRGEMGSHSEAVKLNGIPALSTWLQPWMLPMPNAHGVVLDRATTERPKLPTAIEESVKFPDSLSVLDICTAATASEMLRLWEARESLLSPGADQPGGLVHTLIRADPPPATENESPKFFPSLSLKTRTSVSQQVLMDLVHYGISSLEMPFKDMV